MPKGSSPQDVLTSCQTAALDVLQREGNVFLTGAAGTGKSYLLEKYLKGKSSMAFPVVASTGAAAVLVGGRTFHSFFGLGIMEGGVEAAVARASKNRKVIRRLGAAHCVIIDEISMLSGAMLRAAEWTARRVRGRNEPWGGLRIIVVGDFAQLPPVTHGGMQKDWAFLHEVWQESAFQPALLSTVMRTQESEFLTVLNFIREGTVNDQVRAFLDGRMQPLKDGDEATRLYAHRHKADSYNHERLHRLPGSARTYVTSYEGDEHYMESAKKSMPIPEELQLKEGALVMMRKNDVSEDRLYVNGSLGVVSTMSEDELTVRLLSGPVIEVAKEKFSYLDGDGKEMLAAWNFPVTLAWATTIHKAQGASLDRMTVDLSQLWEPGQAYVALSRVRGAQGLSIEQWNERGIRADAQVTDLYNSMAEASKHYVPRALFTIRELDAPAKTPRALSADQDGGVRERRAALIREKLSECASFASLVEAAGVKPDRVLLYLEELINAGEHLSLSYLLEEVPDAHDIRAAFEELGPGRLKPVSERFRGTIPFPTLRLVRCVMMAEAQA